MTILTVSSDFLFSSEEFWIIAFSVVIFIAAFYLQFWKTHDVWEDEKKKLIAGEVSLADAKQRSKTKDVTALPALSMATALIYISLINEIFIKEGKQETLVILGISVLLICMATVFLFIAKDIFEDAIFVVGSIKKEDFVAYMDSYWTFKKLGELLIVMSFIVLLACINLFIGLVFGMLYLSILVYYKDLVYRHITLGGGKGA